MATYGYVRVSTTDQKPDRQIATMKEQGIKEDLIIVEFASGKDFKRPKYQMLRGILSAGDTLYLDELNRLGRDYEGVIKEWKYLERTKKVDIVCLKPSFMRSDTFKSMGDLGKVYEDQMLSMLSYVAESERKNTLQRQREGIEIAKSKGVYKGRARKAYDVAAFNECAYSVKDRGVSPKWAAKRLGLTYITFYRRYKEWLKSHQ